MANKYLINGSTDLLSLIKTPADTTCVTYNRSNLGFGGEDTTNRTDGGLNWAVVHDAANNNIGFPCQTVTDKYRAGDRYFINPATSNIPFTENSERAVWDTNKRVARIATSGVNGDTAYNNRAILLRCDQLYSTVTKKSYDLFGNYQLIFLTNTRSSLGLTGGEELWTISNSSDAWVLDSLSLSPPSDILGVVMSGAGGGGGYGTWAFLSTRTGGGGGGGGATHIGYLHLNYLSAHSEINTQTIVNIIVNGVIDSDISCFVLQAGYGGSGGSSSSTNGSAGGGSYITLCPNGEEWIIAGGGKGGTGMKTSNVQNSTTAPGGAGGTCSSSDVFDAYTSLTQASGSSGRAGYKNGGSYNLSAASSAVAAVSVAQNGYTIGSFYGANGAEGRDGSNKTGGPGGVTLSGWGYGGYGGDDSIDEYSGSNFGESGIIWLYTR